MVNDRTCENSGKNIWSVCSLLVKTLQEFRTTAGDIFHKKHAAAARISSVLARSQGDVPIDLQYFRTILDTHAQVRGTLKSFEAVACCQRVLSMNAETGMVHVGAKTRLPASTRKKTCQTRREYSVGDAIRVTQAKCVDAGPEPDPQAWILQILAVKNL